jgi:hypothetical protein
MGDPLTHRLTRFCLKLIQIWGDYPIAKRQVAGH